MSLTETKIIDRIEIVDNGHLQVRESSIIMKDGEQIAQTYHRWSFAPGSDISEMPENVKSIAAAAWTPEVIAAYEDKVAAFKSSI